MSEALVREIAQHIVREQFLENWKFYALILCVYIVGVVISTLLTSYVRKRGENFATKADFQELMGQMRATTKTTEEVKTAIAHTDWNTKEWKTLRRIKLEELIESVYAIRKWFEVEQNHRLFGDIASIEQSPFWKVELIHRLYFPELKGEFQVLAHFYHNYHSWMIETQGKLLEAGTNLVKQKAVRETMVLESKQHYQYFVEAISVIEQKATGLMIEIFGI